MHCNICDAELNEKEISWNKDLNTFEPCTVCLDAAMDAAYCDGFVIEEDTSIILDSSFDEDKDSYVRLPYEADPTDEWN